MSTAVYSNRPLTLVILGHGDQRARRDLAEPLTRAARPARRRLVGWVSPRRSWRCCHRLGRAGGGTGEVGRAVSSSPSRGRSMSSPRSWPSRGPGRLRPRSGSRTSTPRGCRRATSPCARRTARRAGARSRSRSRARQQILAATYDGGSLELLTGAAPTTQTCCSSAQAVQVSAGGAGGARADARRRPCRGDAGPAAHAQERRHARRRGHRARRVGESSRPSPTASACQHLLTHGGQMPETLDAAWLGAESSIVAWTSAKGVAGQAAPRSISYALGSKTHAPRGAKTAVTVPRRPSHRRARRRRSPGRGHRRLGRELV